MDRPIERRDFLNGALLTAATAMLPELGLAAPAAAYIAPQDQPGYYPPKLAGLRGSHPGSFEAAHALRDGDFWTHAAWPAEETGAYDLVIVGAGISGLSAAYFWRAKNPQARILILDNHDDFGGHAKRNEFHFGQRTALMNGGTLEIDSPRPYGPIPTALLNELGVVPKEMAEAYSREDFYAKRNMGLGVFLDRETFGKDALLPGLGQKPTAEFLARAPISDAAKAGVTRMLEGGPDPYPGLSQAEKKDRLSRISYGDYIVKVLTLDPVVAKFYQQSTHDEWGVGIDAVSALDAWGFGLPGFTGLKLDPTPTNRMTFTPAGYVQGGSDVFHFPDGNASIARLLVRSLVPGSIPGHTAEDIVMARANYAALDKTSNQVRIRLSSIVVGARNIGGPAASKGVEIAYTRFGKVAKVEAKACILACYNMVIPYLCPEMSEAQKAGLHYLVKTPLVYTSVAITNRRAWEKLGVSTTYHPNGYFVTTRLDKVTEIGGYSNVTGPNDPQLLFMVRTPCQPGGGAERDQNRAGRADMLATSFETFERHIREQLGRTFGPGGFDPAQDITAITVNRWPHGYAYEYNYLFDPVWAPGQAPNEIGRKTFGRIAIANSDSGAGAYTDVAIEQAHRAVLELVTT